METKFTPGPWMPGHHVDDQHTCDCTTIVSAGYMGGIATVHVYNGFSISDGGNDAPPRAEAAANARLIAAAPEMHDLLGKLRAYLTGPQFDPGNRAGYAFMIETALAKAEGR